MLNIKIDNTSFEARCSEIRFAQDACHKVNTNFAHFSYTRFYPAIESINKKVVNTNTPNSEVERLMKTKNAVFKLQTRILKMRKLYENENYFNKIVNLINFLKMKMIGNCYEDAIITEAILRVNGIKNACTTTLMVDNNLIDHRICVFNRNGSEFVNFEPNNTIIIDSWCGLCDYAGNAIKKYKSMYTPYFNIRNEAVFSAYKTHKYSFSENEIQELKEKFPDLIMRTKFK